MKRVLTFISLMLVLCCCKEKQEPQVQILKLAEGQATTLEFNNSAAATPVRFSAESNWMIEIEDPDITWFTITPMYGTAGNALTVRVSVEDYDGTETLNSGFRLVCGEENIEFTVIQRPANDPENPYIAIADSAFEAYLIENFDSDSDNKISKEEAASITRIECSDMEIASLDGIKWMTSLEYLDCSYNLIEGALDLSGMPALEECHIDHNIYTSVNLSNCPSLKILYANDNYDRSNYTQTIFFLEELNISGCPELEFIHIEDNKITSLDLAGCTKLKTLKATWNELESIDVSSCTALEVLQIRKNPLIGTIDLSNCTELQSVTCSETYLEALTLGHHPALTNLDMANSYIASIDLSGCPALKSLLAHSTNLRSIDLSNNTVLESVWLKFNYLTELDLSACKVLKELQMGANMVTSLDLSSCPELTKLEVANNELSSINLKGCSKLLTATIMGNNLTSVDCSDLTSIEQFDVCENAITSLDLNNSPNLIILNCSQNEITDLNIDRCTELTNLWAEYNKISYLDLTRHTKLQEITLHDNALTDIDIAGLPVGVVYLGNNNIERLDIEGCTGLSELYVQDNPLAYLSVHSNSALRQLDCRRTAMKSVDLSNNPSMAFLFAAENPQMETIYILKDASYSTLSCDEHVMVYYKDPQDFDDVNGGNWGDADLNPWA